MNNNFMLPDSVFNTLVFIGALAAAVGITSAEELRDFRRERTISESEPVIRTSKESQSLADYYTAAAYGDFEDGDYWEETAKQFASVDFSKEWIKT